MITEQTPDGLRIQIMDRERRPMFRDGTAELYDYAVKLVQEIGKVVEDLPNRISIHGHTDGKVFERADGYSNWELSSDRASAIADVCVGSHGTTWYRLSNGMVCCSSPSTGRGTSEKVASKAALSTG